VSVYSMTGFATMAGEGFTLTAKSVNHRFLDLQLRLPSGCEEIEALLRGIVRASVKRGHVEVSLDVERGASAVVNVRRNDELLAALIAAHREAEEVHGLLGDPDLNVLLRVPGVVVLETGQRGVELGPHMVHEVAEELMVRFNAARGLEGAALACEMTASMDRLLGLAEEMAALRVGVREAQMERFRERLAGFEIPEERVMAEAAIVAEKSDVEEEIVRLRTHAKSFQGILEGGGEVGKRLDFLLQEMNREANTMVSKVNGALGERGIRLTDVGLAMKSEIERVKEQVQNLE
jgi:uncharacterized protein (TIGR00255 family)